MSKKCLIGMNQADLESFMKELGLEKFRAKQIYEWIYKKSVRDFSEMTNLSQKARDLIAAKANIGSLKLVTRETSSDGTEKFLFETADGEKLESVLMFFENDDYDEDDDFYDTPAGRYSACISSQVGCAVACPFCATGTLGLKKNLNSSEIIEQILFMQNLSSQRISNIVYMGQGEPFNNYDAVLESIRKTQADIGIGARRITVSTSGVIPKINALAKEDLQITLALSLHDPTNEGRDFLVPINRKWPVFEVIDALKDYVDKTNRRVTIEYVLLDGVNDSIEKAKILGNLIKDLHCNINLIPYNQTNTNDPFSRSSSKNISDFTHVLRQYCKGKTVTVRKERGHDINAACGQLANSVS
ncbi:MAG: 23S rRNA (adenine(2503)-C(2))-methyltransferase RlmN [Cyanobacteria bacterium]|nr:23S rRNA (adenine(2503)-C(2))-methyltransferase RlmN [Cyanobacteriota bacterium]